MALTVTPVKVDPYLRLFEQNGQHRVQCGLCNSQNPLPDRLPFPLGTWQQPWIQDEPRNQPEDLAWLLSINDVRVHESWTSTALVIPPESRIRKGTILDRLYCNTVWLKELEGAKSGSQTEGCTAAHRTSVSLLRRRDRRGCSGNSQRLSPLRPNHSERRTVAGRISCSDQPASRFERRRRLRNCTSLSRMEKHER